MLLPGASTLPFRSFFRWRFAEILKRLCHNAYASSYVTAEALQRCYPPAPGKFATHFSDVVTKPVANSRQQFPACGPYRLISVGTMATMNKAYDVLLQAARQVVNAGLDLRLVIIGDGQHLPKMKQLAKDLDIADRVTFRGLVSFGDAINAELDRAHLLVMPSRQEGLPRAMAKQWHAVCPASVAPSVAFQSCWLRQNLFHPTMFKRSSQNCRRYCPTLRGCSHFRNAIWKSPPIIRRAFCVIAALSLSPAACRNRSLANATPRTGESSKLEQCRATSRLINQSSGQVQK